MVALAAGAADASISVNVRFPDPPGESFGTLAGRFVPVGVPAGTNSRLPPLLQSAITIPEDASTTYAGSGSLNVAAAPVVLNLANTSNFQVGAAFRATGQGWQSRMNQVLGEWVHAAHG